MTNKGKVDEFLDKLEHPLKAEMKAIRKIICDVSPAIEEDVKWGGPSFDYKEPMATFNPRVKDCVAIIFHKGELIKDGSGLLEAGPKGKAYIKLASMAAVKANKMNLQNIVKEWMKIMG
jgi:uncharacterized protein YdeI (YjbR/CyaY-like superfamily)